MCIRDRYHILQKRFFAFITVGDEFLARKRLCDELVEVCHLIQDVYKRQLYRWRRKRRRDLKNIKEKYYKGLGVILPLNV